MHTHNNINLAFREYFPSLSNEWELSEIQLDAIANIIKNQNSLCLMPTGSGKSIVYWMSAVLLEGCTIVVSPLIALIQEQADKLSALGFDVLVLHANIPQAIQINSFQKIYNNEWTPNFIFVSPERIATDIFFEETIRKISIKVKLVVIDEIHCISQWGTSFRPFYKRIPNFINAVFIHTKPKVAGLTATLNPKDIQEICTDFNIEYEAICKEEMIMRNEIQLYVDRSDNEELKEQKLWELLEIHKEQKILVYVYRKYKNRGVEVLSNLAQEKGYNTYSFHGDMSAKERSEIIQKYKLKDNSVVFATNAFGMGIDIPDIRVVIHFMIPESVEQYYQEVGRAARDRKPANAYLLYTDKNIKVKKDHFIDKSFPNEETLKETFSGITSEETTIRSYHYFDNEQYQSSFPFLVDSGAIKIHSKGFSSFKNIIKCNDKDALELIKSTPISNAIATSRINNIPIDQVISKITKPVLNREASVNGFLSKCLFVSSDSEMLNEERIKSIKVNIKNKKQYKHDLLDYLVYLANSFESSQYLHRDIGLYFGMDKHLAGKSLKTLRGELVRSKSEVIIANLLYSEGIKYEYEKHLFYSENKHIEPDFTITIDQSEYYWEHLGLIGHENYDRHWIWKKKIYDECFPKRLLTTYENALLSESAKDLIHSIKN